MKTTIIAFAALLSLALASTVSGQTLTAQRLVFGTSGPVYATSAPGDSTRLFIVEQRPGATGRIKILDLTTGQINATPFLTISPVSTGNEQGLLGLAFHPDYQNNGYFYVNYNEPPTGRTIIERYTRQTDDTANPNSANAVMSFSQPFSNHNGGWIGFGPDGYLYIASGDGGSANDPFGNGQSINTMLGKMLRIDINGDDFPSDNTRNYAVPPTNPFVDGAGLDEIWAYGLRNPWRCSFDRVTGDLYIGDVGQNAREEIDFQPANSVGGENYGWDIREGMIGGNLPDAINPIDDYPRSQGQSVTGGYVYRGPVTELRGHYFYADYQQSKLWSFKFNGDDVSDFDGTNFTHFVDWTGIVDTDFGIISSITSLGEDHLGNLYICDRGGEIFVITGGTIPGVDVVGVDTLDILRGTQQGGGIPEMQSSDDTHLVISRHEVFQLVDPPVWIEIEGTSPVDSPQDLSFVLEASASALGVNQKVELFNYDTGLYEIVDQRNATTEDSIVEGLPNGDLSRFIEPGTRTMKARIQWRPITAGLIFWTISIDQASWVVTQ